MPRSQLIFFALALLVIVGCHKGSSDYDGIVDDLSEKGVLMDISLTREMKLERAKPTDLFGDVPKESINVIRKKMPKSASLLQSKKHKKLYILLFELERKKSIWVFDEKYSLVGKRVLQVEENSSVDIISDRIGGKIALLIYNDPYVSVGIINPSDFSYREFSTRFSAHEEFTHCALSKYKLFVLGYDGENSFVKVMDIKSGDIETPFYESKSPGFGFSSYSLSRDGTRIAFTLSRSVTNYSNIYVCGANNAKAFEIVKSKRAFYNCSVLNWTGRKVFFATAANEENKRYFYKVTLKF